MFNFFKTTKNEPIILTILLYLIFLIIGFAVFKDYGISVDEWDLRLLGFVNLKYVMNFFSLDGSSNLDQILKIPNMKDYSGNTHGPIFPTVMSFIEYFANIKDSQKYYFLRHFFNYFIFLIANLYFFFLVKKRFNSWLYGFIGAIFLFLSPRIFSESFYNHKDILFLSIFIINLYYAIEFIKFPSIKNSLLFSLITALSIDTRIMGLIIIPITIFSLILKYFKNKNFNFINGLFVYIFLSFLFTILFWPYMWENPINNFIEVFKSLSSFNWGGYNFYFGDYYKADNLPWHYIPVWLIITTPIFYLILFGYGLFKILYGIQKKFVYSKGYNLNNLWNTENELHDIIYLLLFILPILLIIFLNSTLYNGWRHLYFIYPCFLMLSLNGLYNINSRFKKHKIKILGITSVFLIQILYIMVKDHPYQNVYFNFFAGKNVDKNFEMDYWGLSNKQAFEYILNNDNQSPILIGSAGPISLSNSKKILNLENRNRIKITENAKADYIINNYINWRGNYKSKRYEIPSNFTIYKEIFTGGNKIISIYKKNNL